MDAQALSGNGEEGFLWVNGRTPGGLGLARMNCLYTKELKVHLYVCFITL